MAPLDVMRLYLDAMQRGDRETAFGYYAEDVVFHVPGRSAFAGERRGRDAAIAYIRAAVARAQDVEVELIDMLASKEHVALILRERLQGATRTLDMRRANVYRIRGEQIVEVWIFEGDQYAVDDFLANEPVES
jgi:ketosteroid isomerase-like protein